MQHTRTHTYIYTVMSEPTHSKVVKKEMEVREEKEMVKMQN